MHTGSVPWAATGGQHGQGHDHRRGGVEYTNACSAAGAGHSRHAVEAHRHACLQHGQQCRDEGLQGSPGDAARNQAARQAARVLQ